MVVRALTRETGCGKTDPSVLEGGFSNVPNNARAMYYTALSGKSAVC